jgi:hypothetical protein
MHAWFINRESYTLNFQRSPNSEKWYFKSVSDNEKEKIEWEDKLERFTRLFLAYDIHELRNQKELNLNSSLL